MVLRALDDDDILLQCGPLARTVACNVQNCPSGPLLPGALNVVCLIKLLTSPSPLAGEGDCQVSEWRTDGTCSAPCGGGTVVQRRRITARAVLGGRDCPPELTRVVACNAHPCDGSVGGFWGR